MHTFRRYGIIDGGRRYAPSLISFWGRGKASHFWIVLTAVVAGRQGEGQGFLLGDTRGVGALISGFKQLGDTERSMVRDHLSLGRIP